MIDFKYFGRCLLSLIAIGCATAAQCQDIEPRRWTPLPPGLNVIGAGYALTDGDVYFDPALQVEDATVRGHTVGVSYVRSFRLAGKLARFDVVLPWQHIEGQGLLEGEPASVSRTGLADPVFRFSMILAGDRPDLAAKSNTVFGAAVAVIAPAGEYFENKLLNLGQNRWTLRPQVGVVHTRGQWSYELTASVFLYADNDEFFGGAVREQDPLLSVQGHVIRTFNKRGYWLSLSAGHGGKGQSIINAAPVDDEKRLFLSALSFGMPVGESQALKFAYVQNRTKRNNGSDTDSLLASWSLRF